MKQKIFIETNECDYMTYFELAAEAMKSGLFQHGNRFLLDTMRTHNTTAMSQIHYIKEIFLSFTKTFYELITGSTLSEITILGLRRYMEIYINEEADKKIKEYQDDNISNASDLLIEY